MSSSTKQSTGTTTNVDGADDDDMDINDAQEMDDARYSAEMIQDAFRNIKNADKLSSYERRVALREIKEIIQQLVRETETVVTDVVVRKFLEANESEKTEEQFLVLREEMLRLMKRCDSLEARISDLCQRIQELYRKIGRDQQPRDILEVKILKKPKSLRPSPTTITVLLSILSTLEQAVEDNLNHQRRKRSSNSEEEDDEEDKKETERTYNSLKQDLLDVLAACSVDDAAERDAIFQDFGCATIPDIKIAHARIVSSIAALQELQAKVSALPPPPIVDPLWRQQKRNDDAADAFSLATHEKWIEEGRAILSECQAWELLSGVPFHAPVGAIMFLRRCWPPGDTKVAKLLFPDLLQMVLSRMENGKSAFS